jgi:mannose-6-phosphate isomerase-like protein (cupin superfamily)
MQLSDLGADAVELSRSLAPIDPEALNTWREGAVLVGRRGRRGADRQDVFLRLDYAGQLDGSTLVAELTACRLDPLSREPLDTVGQQRIELGRTSAGTWAVELRGGADAAARADVCTVEVPWLAAAFPDPVAGQVSPMRLEVRLICDEQTDPPVGESPFELVFGAVQQRNRSNSRRHITPMGSGQQEVTLFFTNPRAEGLNVLKRIQPPFAPPYSELNSDLRLFWEYRVPAGGWVNAHRHATEEIWHVTEGEATYVHDGEERVIRSGDTVIAYPGSWHRVSADRGVGITWLVIDVGVARSNQPH